MGQQTTLIQVGDKAPLWSATSNQGQVNIADCLGQKSVLLIFYPADWSNVCSDELPLLEELINLSGNVRLETYGISGDSVASHTAFARQIGLRNITLVSDHQHTISRAYGLEEEQNYTKRATILIDEQGIVRWLRIEPDVMQPRPLDELEKALQLVRQWDGLPAELEKWRNERQYAMQLERPSPLPTPTQLQLRFWGTRGSIPVSGMGHSRYGGNTSCVSLTSDTGHLYVFDCGSGARELGNFLLSPEWPPANAPKPPSSTNGDKPPRKNINGYLLLSHTHWDHIQGFPFFTPVFIPGNRFNIIGGSNCAQTLSGILAGQMEQCYFPVGMDVLPSELSFYSIQYNPAILDGAKLRGRPLHHPIPSTAYRLELAGTVIVYATDHEPRKLPDLQEGVLLGDDVVDMKLVELAQGADILIHDAQYSIAELAQKVGWGHNSAEVAVDTAIRAKVKRLVLYHHDPSHDDDTIDELLAIATKRAASFTNIHKLEVVAASDGMCFDFKV